MIFSELKSGRTIEETAETLTREYDVTLEKAKSDVEKTIASLKEAGAKEMDNIVRRDIIQGVITYYFLNVISKPAYLKEWRSTGGLA